MKTKSILEPAIKVARTAVGLEKTVVELYQGSSLCIIAYDATADSKLVTQYGVCKAHCEFEEQYQETMRKLKPFIRLENELQSGKIKELFDEPHFCVYQFTTYDQLTVNAWITRINANLQLPGASGPSQFQVVYTQKR